MRLGSLEYLQEVASRSNSDEQYRALAKGQYETYTLVLEPQPDKGVVEPIIVGFDCQDGEYVEVWEGSRPTLFTISAPYGFGWTSCAASWEQPRRSPCAC